MNPEDAAETIREKAKKHGEAHGQRIYLEEFRKSKKALLMKDALAMGVEAANAQEREADADPEYVSLLKGLAAAAAEEITTKWEIEAARLDIEIWKARVYLNKKVDRAHE